MSVGQTITVVVPAGPPPTTVAVAAAESSAGAPMAGTLPRTGAPLLPLLLAVAVGLMLAGRMLLAVSRRLEHSAGGRSARPRLATLGAQTPGAASPPVRR